MAIAYTKLIRQVALRINAIVGVQAAALATSYGTSPLTSTQVASADFPLLAIQDAVINSVGKLVRAYASVDGHPFRNFNLSQTSSIANDGVIPSANSAGRAIVGVYGAVRDATTGDVLTEQPVQLINNLRSNQDSFLKGDYFYYKIVGNRIRHTRTNVVMDVCTFDRGAEETAITANGNAPIPDALEDAAVAGAVSMLVRDDEFAAQAVAYANYFNNVIAEIKGGAQTFSPTLINTQEARIS